MNDQAAFIASIRESPDCDTQRLVYADWIDENADALTDVDIATSEYIRLSCGYGKWAATQERSWVWANWRRFIPRIVNFSPQTKSSLSVTEMTTDVVYSDVSFTAFSSYHITFRFSRGFIHGAWLNRSSVDALVPFVVSECPIASIMVWDVLRGAPNPSITHPEFRIYDFAPRSIWQSIQGHDATGTDGIHDYLAFTGERPLTRASAALSDALRKYGEQVNFYRRYSESMTGVKGGMT